jgi:fatty-acyl-CoA synthase
MPLPGGLLQVSQGRPHMFCDMRLVDDDGQELPRDGTAVGHLQVGGEGSGAAQGSAQQRACIGGVAQW